MNHELPIRIELPTAYGMHTVNAWLFVNPEPVLIDCGEDTEASWKALQAGLANHGLNIQDLSRVIITHAHVDHMGMIGRIAAHSDAEIWVSELVEEWAVNLEEMRETRIQAIDHVILELLGDPEAPLRKLFLSIFQTFSNSWKAAPAHRVRVYELEESLTFGGREWNTLYTPGHSITQSCFFSS